MNNLNSNCTEFLNFVSFFRFFFFLFNFLSLGSKCWNEYDRPEIVERGQTSVAWCWKLKAIHSFDLDVWLRFFSMDNNQYQWKHVFSRLFFSFPMYAYAYSIVYNSQYTEFIPFDEWEAQIPYTITYRIDGFSILVNLHTEKR